MKQVIGIQSRFFRRLIVLLFFLTGPFAGFAANRYWVGGGSSNDWDATGNTNWSATSGGTNNASLPGFGDDVIFDANSSGPCVISSAIGTFGLGVASINTTGFTGPIIQNAGVNIIFLSGGMTIGGGVFNGSNGSITIIDGGFTQTAGIFNASTGGVTIFSGGFAQAGGTFNANSTTITIWGAASWTHDGGNYNEGSSTVTFRGGSAQTITGISSSHTFYNLIVNKSGGTLSQGGSIVTLNVNDLTNTAGNFNASGFNTLNINATAANSDFVLTAGTFTAPPTINITGNWTKNGGTYTHSSGTVNFTGTSSQAIGGSSATAFYNLSLNSGSASSPQFTLGINTSVNNTLNMLAGNINLAGFTLTIGTAAGTPGSLSYTAGWMYGGSLARWYNNSTTIADGNVTGFFPVGTSSNSRPFYVYWSTAPSAGGTLTMLHTDPGTGPTVVSFPDGSGNTVVRRTDLNWRLTAANGFNIAGGNLNVRVGGTNIGTVGNINDLRVTLVGSCDGSNGTNAGTTSNPIVKRIALTGLTAASRTFYVGTKDAGTSPLPVEFLWFYAEPKGQAVEVNWSTAAEFNSDYFLVQRSKEGVLFEDLQQVESFGNSSVINHYSATDPDPYSGASYYRLKQVDNDGKFAYSKVIAVKTGNEQAISVFPNPSSGTFNLLLDGKKGDQVQIIIRDIQGKEYYSSEMYFSSDFESLPVDLSGKIAPGMYDIEIASNRSILHKKVVIR